MKKPTEKFPWPPAREPDLSPAREQAIRETHAYWSTHTRYAEPFDAISDLLGLLDQARAALPPENPTMIDPPVETTAATEEEWAGDPLQGLVDAAEEIGRLLAGPILPIGEAGKMREYTEELWQAQRNLSACAALYHHAPAAKKLAALKERSSP